MDAMHGTNLNAGATARTLLVVDDGEIVLYVDGVVGTGLFTLLTADTAVGTVLSGICACVVV